MSIELLFSILFLAPLLGFVFNGLRFKKPTYKLAGAVASFCAGLSFLSAAALVKELYKGRLLSSDAFLQVSYFDWLSFEKLSVPFSFVLDPINSVMILLVTGVGFLIHLFSIGYMSHDARPSKYFAYLNFFLFNMLLLILGDNLLVMFVGWEGVGLCSYLLIGFWFTDKEKAAAGMKAFVVNRIGDAGFLLGIFILWNTLGTINFFEINELSAEAFGKTPATLALAFASLFLFIGAIGKSAQIPLFVWLPDAMAGPTPVSALIHAATMVTAGVYMILRMNFLFITSPSVMFFIAVTGLFTMLISATIALSQNDIKKVLAYSTVSQLGYMFLATGVGAWVAALFHLLTHGFFKALLFLGSGSVIHALEGEQDMRKMGGLKKKLPITYWTFFIGWLAIIGLPPFAGFFSKDEILWSSYASSTYGHWFIWFLGFVGAGMTAFYMTRLMALTFWGEYRGKVKPHGEGGIVMSLPLIVLAVLSVFGGFLGIPHVISVILPTHPPHFLADWLKGSFFVVSLKENHLLEIVFMVSSILWVILMSLIAYAFSLKKHQKRKEDLVQKLGGVYKITHNKYWVDEIYNSQLIQPFIKMSQSLWKFVDLGFIDGASRFTTHFFKENNKLFLKLQNGSTQRYLLYISFGVVFILSVSLMGWV